MGGNSNSRIKVDLSQQEDDGFGNTGMEHDHHMIHQKPMLNAENTN